MDMDHKVYDALLVVTNVSPFVLLISVGCSHEILLLWQILNPLPSP